MKAAQGYALVLAIFLCVACPLRGWSASLTVNATGKDAPTAELNARVAAVRQVVQGMADKAWLAEQADLVRTTFILRSPDYTAGVQVLSSASEGALLRIQAAVQVDEEKIRTTLQRLSGQPPALTDSSSPDSPSAEKATEDTPSAEKAAQGKPEAPPTLLSAPDQKKEDALAEAALVGRWGNSGVRYGFSDDGYFYKRTVISHLNTRSTYIPSSRRYSGNYIYETPGRWEYSYYTTYTYLNTLYGRYAVRGGLLRFTDVISMAHTTFDESWYWQKTRDQDAEKMGKALEKASFVDDFRMEYEFLSPERIRLRSKDADNDYFWELDEVAHSVPIPGRMIPPAQWPAAELSPEIPVPQSKGRLREVTQAATDSGGAKITIVMDRAKAVPDLTDYRKTLISLGWWMEEPGKDKESIHIQGRKGLWELTIKNGNGPSRSRPDTLVIEAVRHPQGQWPEIWSKAGMEPPPQSVIIGPVEHKPDETNRGISKLIFFDGVDDSGLAAYGAQLQKAGFAIPKQADGKWQWLRYLRLGNDLYRAEISSDGRYGNISSFNYKLTYFPDGAWPAVWGEGGLPAPPGSETIVGAVDMEGWNDKENPYRSFYSRITFLGLDQKEVDAYFAALQAAGFTREPKSDPPRLFAYLRVGGRLSRVEVQQEDHNELTQLRFSFSHFEDGVWPAVWSEGGLPAPLGSKTIAGAVDMEGWNDKDNPYRSFYSRIRFLGLDQKKVDAYFAALQAAGFTREPKSDPPRLFAYLRFGGRLSRVEVQQEDHNELTELRFSFRHFEDGVWPAVWREGGLPAPLGSKAIVGALDMESWNNKDDPYRAFYPRIHFLGLDQQKVDAYFAALQAAGFTRKPDSDPPLFFAYLRFGERLSRVEVQQEEDNELTKLRFAFSHYRDGVWPAVWSEGGLPAPLGSKAIVGALDMERWNNKDDPYGSFYPRIHFLGLDQKKVDAYFASLQAAGFTRKPDTDPPVFFAYLRFGGRLSRVEVEQEKNDELTLLRFTFSHIKDGVWPAVWGEGGLPAPVGSKAIVGTVDMESWDNKNSPYGSFSTRIRFLDLDQKKVDTYFAALRVAGFTRMPDRDPPRFVAYLRFGGRLSRAEVEQEEHRELTNLRFSFNHFEDGVWPAVWREGGLPAPLGSKAIVGALDMERWNDKNNPYGSFNTPIRFLGLDQKKVDAYFAALQAAGFTRVPDRDPPRFFAYLRLGGRLSRVAVEQEENNEITQLRFAFDHFEDGQWPAAWREGGLPAPVGSKAIVGALDMERWNNKSDPYRSFSTRIRFLGLDQKQVDAYFAALQAAGFTRESDADPPRLFAYLRLGGTINRVEAQQHKDSELADIYYSFQPYEEGVWPEDWKSIPAPRHKGIVGPFDLKRWQNREGWYGSYSTNMRFMGANLKEYAAALQQNGFTRPKDPREPWELEKPVRLGNKTYRLTISDNNNKDIPEVGFQFREVTQ